MLEVLVAVAVLGLLLVLLGQGLSFGIHAAALQARAQAEGSDDLVNAERVVRTLVAAADPGIYPEPASLRGSSNSLSLLTDGPAEGGVDRRIDATLYVAGGQLRLRWTPHRHVAPFGPPAPAQETTLLDGIDGLRIAYAAPGHAEWRPVWNGETLPALIRFELAFQSPSRHWPPIIVAPIIEAAGQ